ncbi:BTAD domain-containing putative transcriptional regulator [Saccharothrix sp. HUAS TT1]|uniref:AfsR/SARP family transcriptional regulator n=1 Tax=unclassified Saccharothrix TaxID=2593673 RepID=UPI00345C0BB9
MHRFHRLAKQGRAELAAGSPEVASRLLREALALWRGPALADLVETGTSWPELTALQNARLDAMEDWFEAELACGRHYTAVDELELLVETEPLRERLCGQLMVAQYRSGRQADALRTYSRVRTALAGGLGLEPGKELQSLQRAILAHDPVLAVPTPRAERSAPPPPPARATGQAQISVLMVKVPFPADRREETFERVAATIREKAGALGGVVTGSIGSVTLALFASGADRQNSALRAVRAAAAIRDALHDPAGETTVRAAVVTGPGRPGAEPFEVNGALLGSCEALLANAAAGAVWACDHTRHCTASVVAYRRVSGASLVGWELCAAELTGVDHGAEADADPSECELRLLLGLLGVVRHRNRPHLVTMLSEGEPTILSRFEQVVGAGGDPRPRLIKVGPARGAHAVHASRARILAEVCGVGPNDTSLTVRGRLESMVRCAATSDGEVRRLVDGLLPLLDPDSTPPHGAAEVWRLFLDRLTLDAPLVVVAEDLHRGDEALLDFVAGLADMSRSVPVLVVVAAHPDLLAAKPDWSLRPNTTTLLVESALPYRATGVGVGPKCATGLDEDNPRLIFAI